jgi:hypothetical protein
MGQSDGLQDLRNLPVPDVPTDAMLLVWHMAYSPRVCRYTTQALGLVRTHAGLRRNVVERREWFVHVYGCGSGCMGAKVFNLKGETIWISGSPIGVALRAVSAMLRSAG